MSGPCPVYIYCDHKIDESEVGALCEFAWCEDFTSSNGSEVHTHRLDETLRNRKIGENKESILNAGSLS